MILNAQSVEIIRQNATRLAECIRTKDDLADLATANSFEQAFSAIESILINTDMYFDDEFLSELNAHSWQSFKATLLVYTLNGLNKRLNMTYTNKSTTVSDAPQSREFGAMSNQ